MSAVFPPASGASPAIARQDQAVAVIEGRGTACNRERGAQG